MTSSKRIGYLDMAKGIGMVFVVMGHVEYVSEPIRQFISLFHMPLFFIISGILIWEKKEEEIKFIKLTRRKLKRIMLPYAVFSLLSFIIEGGRLLFKGLDGWDVVFRQLFQSLCLQGVSTLWFLPALFFGELLFVGIRKHCKHGATVGLVSVIGTAAALLNVAEQQMYGLHAESLAWGMAHDVMSMVLRNAFCIVFIGVGYYLGMMLPKVDKRWQELTGFLTAVGLTAFMYCLNSGVDLRYMKLKNVLLFLIGAVAGTLMVLFLCKLLEGLHIKLLNRLLSYYGRNSLIIMVTHMDFRVLYCSMKIAAILNTLWSNQFFFCTMIIVFVFVLEIPIIWFINRYLPFILGKNREIS